MSIVLKFQKTLWNVGLRRLNPVDGGWEWFRGVGDSLATPLLPSAHRGS